jgi:sugar phosphate isomerase/epimerase
MALFEPFSLGTNLCMAYSLGEALDIVKEGGFNYAEISSIIHMCEHVEPALMVPEYAALIKNLLDSKGIKCHAVSGHVDPTYDDQCDMLMKKLEFAGRIGAKIVNTNAGSRDRIDDFWKNLKKLIPVAEKWNVIIGFESHGDIVHTAQESVEIFKKINHSLVRLNYDTGNTYFYCNGNIKIEEDIKYGEEFLVHLHLKDITIKDNKVEYVPIGDGDVNFPPIFEWLKTLGRTIPCGLEIPIHVKGILGSIKPTGVPMPKQDILTAVSKSVSYVKSLL